MRNYPIKLRIPNIGLYLHGGNRNSFGLFNLMISTFWENIITYFVKVSKTIFPRYIGDFRFVSHIKKKGFKKSYMLAIYENQKGEKAVAKMRSTKIKGYHYYSLLNEVNIYDTVNKALTRIGDKIPPEFKHMYIPKLLRKVQTEEYLIALIEYVDGKTAENLSSREKITLYFKTVEYLNFLSKHLTEEEKKQISKRTTASYILFYPFLLVKAMIACPGAIVFLLKGTVVLIINLPKILKNYDPQYVFIHRDLHFANIIVAPGKIALIDLQHCVFTESLHEFVTTLRYFWKEDDFHKLFLQEIYKRYKHRRNFNFLFKTFIINSVTHGLTDNSFAKKTLNNWIDFLKFGLSLKAN